MNNLRLLTACLVLAAALGLRADQEGERSESPTSAGPTTPAVPVGVPPTIVTAPAAVIATVGGAATFTVSATAPTALSYRWWHNDRRIETATSATLTVARVTLADAGTYTVVVTSAGGASTSSSTTLAVNVVPGTITLAPKSQVVKAGSAVTLSATTVGTGLTYRWQLNGRTLASQTAATLSLPNVGATSEGTYTLVVANASGIAATASATLGVTFDARLTNLSTRGQVGSNEEVLIIGFVTRGTGTKRILVRAVGPTLKTKFAVADALLAPKLTVTGTSHGAHVSDTNSGWGGTAALTQVFTQVGAFALPATSLDAALLESLEVGSFTATVTAPAGTTGTALAEMYDADTTVPTAELVNLSARAAVGSEVAQTLIAGFVVSGTTSETVLIRGVGPTLGTGFGMRGALPAAKVTLFDAHGAPIALNAAWSDWDNEHDEDLDGVGLRVGAFSLSRGTRDAAMVATLAPGAYTVHVSGVNGGNGVALVEIYEVR